MAQNGNPTNYEIATPTDMHNYNNHSGSGSPNIYPDVGGMNINAQPAHTEQSYRNHPDARRTLDIADQGAAHTFEHTSSADSSYKEDCSTKSPLSKLKKPPFVWGHSYLRGMDTARPHWENRSAATYRASPKRY